MTPTLNFKMPVNSPASQGFKKSLGALASNLEESAAKRLHNLPTQLQFRSRLSSNTIGQLLRHQESLLAQRKQIEGLQETFDSPHLAQMLKRLDGYANEVKSALASK